jgi:hypothetical protein
MFKRVVLSFAFLAAIGAAGLGVGSKAMAWDDCGSGYRAAYYPAYPAYYGYGPAVSYYRPSVVAYRPPLVVRDRHFHDDHHHHHHDRDRNFVSFSFGF